jgi:membrane-associated phospholipid phosphatase
VTRVSWKYRSAMGCLFVATHALLYVYPNLFPPMIPMELPLFPLEKAIPILPWTFLIYLSDYALGVVAVVLLDDAEEFQAFVRMAFFTLALCGTIYFFCPTIYPRPEYPKSNIRLFEFAMNLVRTVDSPTNSFPSLHVALTMISAWAVRKRGPKISVFFWIWSIAIFISTLTTKQHYLIDIVGGMTIAAAVIALNHLLYEKKFLQTLGAYTLRK